MDISYDAWLMVLGAQDKKRFLENAKVNVIKDFSLKYNNSLQYK
mgnify:CR=1 FL=1